MGHNIDLIELTGAPEMVKCPHCQMNTDTWYDDFDIDCSMPNKKSSVSCSHCDEEFFIQLEFKTQVKVTKEK